MLPRLRLGVLGSGSGSNLQAILDAIDAGRLEAQVVLVLSDNPQGLILERAERRGIPSAVIDCRGYRSLFPLEAQREVAGALLGADCQLICLAGFMRLLGAPLLDAFPGRIVNIHPSLLPAFPGLEAWRQALDAGVDESGCTVHYVDSGMDTGPIIAQRRVPVAPDDTPGSLHARIQEQEHQLYPAVIGELAAQINTSP